MLDRAKLRKIQDQVIVKAEKLAKQKGIDKDVFEDMNLRSYLPFRIKDLRQYIYKARLMLGMEADKHYIYLELWKGETQFREYSRCFDDGILTAKQAKAELLKLVPAGYELIDHTRHI